MGSKGNDLDVHAAAVVQNDSTIDPNDVDQILSRELANLSVQGREAIMEEVHGVRCLAVEETLELLRSSLRRLSEELNLIVVKPAFNRCQELARTQFPKTSHVNSPEFRLRFLRADFFDAKKAAMRLVTHLEIMMELFDGKEELLMRQIRLSDFSRTEMAILKTGNFQLLPYRDRSGRRVLTLHINLSLALEFMMTAKILFYYMLVASECIETQRKGIVKICYPTVFSSNFLGVLPGPDHRRIASKMNASYPVRLVAMHICAPDTFFFRVLRAIVIVTKHGDQKFRVVSHSGSYTEWHYQLMGYGIPIDLLPISPTGNVKTLMLLQWLKVRKMIESKHSTSNDSGTESSGDDSSTMAAEGAVECPNLNDVVFRPGKSYMVHPGNVMFRSSIESKMDEHFAATRSEKAAIAWSIVREVELRGGRFLKWDNRGWWTEFEDRSEIRYKIPTYFRDFKRNSKARKKRKEILENKEKEIKS